MQRRDPMAERYIQKGLQLAQGFRQIVQMGGLPLAGGHEFGGTRDHV